MQVASGEEVIEDGERSKAFQGQPFRGSLSGADKGKLGVCELHAEKNGIENTEKQSR